MSIRLLTNCVLLALLFFSSPAFSADYQPWSEKVFLHIKETYGPQAEERMRYLHNLILENQNLPVPEKLKLVNDTMNHLPWIADETHWKNADYWATPLETITTFGGDCEDIAIAKWVVLNHFGVDSKYLRLAYVKIKQTGENHMVLLYIDRPDLPPEQQRALVLDNYVKEIKKGSERTDLLAIYVTDANGNMVLIADNGKERSIKGIYEGQKMRKIEDLKKKIAENRAQLQELNDGRPFLPPNP